MRNLNRSSDAKKLDFLIAGAQKCGTTALWQFLRQHPDIQFGKCKELHFFDNENVDWANPPLSALHSQFDNCADGRKLGDATPIYTYWTPSHVRIRDYNRDIRFIVSLRNPIDRAYSHWRMETARNAETLSFSEAIRHGRKRVRRQAEIGGCHRVFSYVERGFYLEQLDRLFALFPEEQILLLRQRDLVDHHASTLDKICDFLSVDRFAVYPDRKEVFSCRAAAPDLIDPRDAELLWDLYATDLDAIRKRYGLDLSRSELICYRHLSPQVSTCSETETASC